MKAIIAGAGIAGPVVAIAMQQIGVEVELFEARDAVDGDEGLFLTLASNGHRVLDVLGLDALIRAEPHIPTPRVAVHGAQGNRLGTVSIGRSTTDAPITLMRHSLHRALSAEAERRGVAVRRGAPSPATGRMRTT